MSSRKSSLVDFWIIAEMGSLSPNGNSWGVTPVTDDELPTVPTTPSKAIPSAPVTRIMVRDLSSSLVPQLASKSRRLNIEMCMICGVPIKMKTTQSDEFSIFRRVVRSRGITIRGDGLRCRVLF